MFSTLFSVALFFSLAIHSVFAEFTVSEPEIHACKGKDVKVTWQAAKAPYNVLVVPADEPCGDALVDAGDFHDTFGMLKTDHLKAGQIVLISIEDANGEEGWSKPITVKGCPASSGTPHPTSNTAPAAGGYGSPSVPSTLPSALGAVANAGLGATSAAVPRHISIPAVALSAVVGAVALLL